MGGLRVIYNAIPQKVRNLLIVTNGWLVGSTVQLIINNKQVNDYDIIVPDGESLMIAMQLLRGNTITLNSWGGFRIVVDNISIDIWVETLQHFIETAHTFTYAYNMRRAKLIRKWED